MKPAAVSPALRGWLLAGLSAALLLLASCTSAPRPIFPAGQGTTLPTLDYPGARLVLAPSPLIQSPPRPAPRSATIAFNNERNTPLVPVQLGNESFIVQVDTGSDGGLSLNPAGLHPRFANGPRAG